MNLNGQQFDYRGGHAPSSDAPPLHDLLATDHFPSDVYTAPQHYTHGSRERYNQESVSVVQSARGKPDALVTVHRAVPPHATKEINPGDWVSLSKSYAQAHGSDRNVDEWIEPKNPNQVQDHEGWQSRTVDWPVVSKRVPAKHVRNGGNDLIEWGYFPHD